LPVSRRVSLTDEGLAVLRRAFTGEAFSFAGERYTVQNVKVMRPEQMAPGLERFARDVAPRLKAAVG
jgi:alkanesulfonate monooxygenase SsuD/methylene tetrahydromethanopterin reductase-like flavin-dependent oxidoreductase (luciferase family)